MRKYHRSILLTSSQAFVFIRTISSSIANYNLKIDALSSGWNGVVPLKATVTIDPGVNVSSVSTGTYSFSTGSSLPSKSSLTLINNGSIIGRGGGGGSGGGWSSQAQADNQALYGTKTPDVLSSAGTSGGPAFFTSIQTSVTNNGIIGGGGGGGGGGQPLMYGAYGLTPGGSLFVYSWRSLGAGAGGGGAGFGSGGFALNSYTTEVAGNPGYLYNYAPTNAGAGNAATGFSGGAGGGGGYQSPVKFVGTSSSNKWWAAGDGGSGGGLGSSGNAGGGIYGFDYTNLIYPDLRATTSAAGGGAAGVAVNAGGLVTWVVSGTIYGSII